MKVLVTGGTGFVGGGLVPRLLDGGFQVRVATRGRGNLLPDRVEKVSVGDIANSPDLRSAVDGIDVVVHLAARVHDMRDRAVDALAEYRRINVEATRQLARSAHAAGARRFIFMSSIKVHGERTMSGCPFSAESVPNPQDAYGVSKAEAEECLREIARESGLEAIIIRPVLVYGPGVRGNFLSMLRWLMKGVPLPLGAIDNRRSLVALGNLVDLITVCVHHPAAANQTFLVSDGEDISTTRLLERMAHALGRSPRLIPVPSAAIRAAAQMVGKSGSARRLLDSLQVDIAKTRSKLGWTPTISIEDALRITARWFLSKTRARV